MNNLPFFTEKSVSPAGQVNKTDLKKIARDTAIFFAAPALMYLGQLQGTLNQNHFVAPANMIPNLTTIGSIEGWVISIAINFFLKFSDGKK